MTLRSSTVWRSRWPTGTDRWIAASVAAVYVYAFALAGQVLLQVGWSLNSVARPWPLLDATVLAALGFALHRRSPWASGALVAYQTGDVISRVLWGTMGPGLVAAGAVLLLYAGTARCVHRTVPASTARAWRLPAVGAASLLILVPMWSHATRAVAFDYVTREFDLQLLAEPELHAALGEDPSYTIADLAKRGFRRLPDAALIERTRIVGQVFALMPPAACTAQLRGQSVSLTPALRQLDVETLRAWYQLTLSAVRAEHYDTPPVVEPPSPERLGDAIGRVAHALPTRQRERFRAIGERFQHATDEEACWFLRTLVDTSERIPAKEQGVIAPGADLELRQGLHCDRAPWPRSFDGSGQRVPRPTTLHGATRGRATDGVLHRQERSADRNLCVSTSRTEA